MSDSRMPISRDKVVTDSSRDGMSQKYLHLSDRYSRVCEKLGRGCIANKIISSRML